MQDEGGGAQTYPVVTARRGAEETVTQAPRRLRPHRQGVNETVEGNEMSTDLQ